MSRNEYCCKFRCNETSVDMTDHCKDHQTCSWTDCGEQSVERGYCDEHSRLPESHEEDYCHDDWD